MLYDFVIENDLASRLYITDVFASVVGDKFFKFNKDLWYTTTSLTTKATNGCDQYDTCFSIYSKERK
jgi:dihydrofolate reductase